jgi:hypothetical protein
MTSLPVKPVTFLSVIYTSKSHNIEFWKFKPLQSGAQRTFNRAGLRSRVTRLLEISAHCVGRPSGARLAR